MENNRIVSKLFLEFRLWGVATVVSLILFVGELAVLAMSEGTATLAMFVVLLMTGFLWIGTTAMSRHSLVRLKDYMDVQVSTAEFLSTHFIGLLYPFVVRKVRREVDSYKKSRRGWT